MATATTAPSTSIPPSQNASKIPSSSSPANPLTSTHTNGTSTHPIPSLNPTQNKETAWHNPGPSAFDLRSDTITTPTLPMLHSITATTLLDDVFAEDPTTNSLEAFCADLTSFEAGLLVMSGTMGNQIALKAHLSTLGGPASVVLDRRSHIYGWEAGGLASANGALAIPVSPRDGHHITLEDVQSAAVVDEDVHACPTRVICLENTLAGTILPLSEAARISAWVSAHNTAHPSQQIRLHLDGARLWEAAAAHSPSRDAQMQYLRDYCANFDSASLCFSKGLGAPIGSILLGSGEFVKRARHFRKAFGGGTRQAGIISAPARVSVEDTFLAGKLRASHENARRLAGTWEKLGGRLEHATETNMVWLDLQAAGVKNENWVDACGSEGVRVRGGRLVVHYQVCEEALEGLKRAMGRVLGKGVDGEGLNGETRHEVRRDVVERDLGKMSLNVE